MMKGIFTILDFGKFFGANQKPAKQQEEASQPQQTATTSTNSSSAGSTNNETPVIISAQPSMQTPSTISQETSLPSQSQTPSNNSGHRSRSTSPDSSSLPNLSTSSQGSESRRSRSASRTRTTRSTSPSRREEGESVSLDELQVKLGSAIADEVKKANSFNMQEIAEFINQQIGALNEAKEIIDETQVLLKTKTKTKGEDFFLEKPATPQNESLDKDKKVKPVNFRFLSKQERSEFYYEGVLFPTYEKINDSEVKNDFKNLIDAWASKNGIKVANEGSNQSQNAQNENSKQTPAQQELASKTGQEQQKEQQPQQQNSGQWFSFLGNTAPSSSTSLSFASLFTQIASINFLTPKQGKQSPNQAQINNEASNQNSDATQPQMSNSPRNENVVAITASFTSSRTQVMGSRSRSSSPSPRDPSAEPVATQAQQNRDRS